MADKMALLTVETMAVLLAAEMADKMALLTVEMMAVL